MKLWWSSTWPSFKFIADPKLRKAAIVELTRLVDAGTVDVYRSHGGRTWNVWLDEERRRVPLEQWVEEFTRRAA